MYNPATKKTLTVNAGLALNITFDCLTKRHLERFNQIYILAVYQHPHWEATCICQTRGKVINSLWENCLQVKTVDEKLPHWKMSHILPFWPLKMTFRTIQPNPYFYSILVPKEASCKQKKKKTLSCHFWEINSLSQKLTDGRTTDGRRTDDGQLGIRKAPLPFGCRS